MIRLHRLANNMGEKIIETDRLYLEEASSNDDLFFLELLNSPNWLKFIGDRSIKSRSDAVGYIRNNLIKSYQDHGFGLYKVSSKLELKSIGICGFVKRSYLEFPDIGFAILPSYEGKGIATEAAKAVLDFGVVQLRLTEILGITTKENIGSQRVLNKIGLKHKNYFCPPNEKEELILFSNKK